MWIGDLYVDVGVGASRGKDDLDGLGVDYDDLVACNTRRLQQSSTTGGDGEGVVEVAGKADRVTEAHEH